MAINKKNTTITNPQRTNSKLDLILSKNFFKLVFGNGSLSKINFKFTLLFLFFLILYTLSFLMKPLLFQFGEHMYINYDYITFFGFILLFTFIFFVCIYVPFRVSGSAGHTKNNKASGAKDASKQISLKIKSKRAGNTPRTVAISITAFMFALSCSFVIFAFLPISNNCSNYTGVLPCISSPLLYLIGGNFGLIVFGSALLIFRSTRNN